MPSVSTWAESHSGQTDERVQITVNFSVSQNASANTSTITITSITCYYNYDYYSGKSFYIDGIITVDNKQIFYSNYKTPQATVSAGSWETYTISGGTRNSATITHNSDGTKTVTFRFAAVNTSNVSGFAGINGNYEAYQFFVRDSSDCSKTYTLPTISQSSNYSWKNLGSGSASTSKSYSLADHQVGYYTFTPSSAGTLSVSTTGASDSYGGIGTSVSLSSDPDATGDSIVTGEIIDNDDSSGYQFACSTTVSSGTSYRIFVHNYGGGADSGTLNITFTATPTGYSWKSLGSGSSSSVSFSLSSNQVGYYLYTPSGAGTLVVSTTSDYDTYGGIGVNGNLTLNSSGSGSSVVSGTKLGSVTDDYNGDSDFYISGITVAANTTYRIYVHQYSVSSASGTLNITFTPAVTNYTCTINPNGGTYKNSSGNNATANDSYTFTSNHRYVPICATSTTAGVTSPTSDTGIVARYYISKPTKTGYTLSSWTTNPSSVTITSYAFGAGNMYSSSGNPKCNFTATAQWTANTYTVTFNANGGGTPSSSTKTVTYNSTYGTLPTISRTNYSFNGWYTAASGGTKITSTSTVSTASDHNLYAQWTRTGFTVTFNKNGGNTPSPTSKAVTNGSTYGTLATCTRDGYTLKGWYTATSGGTKITSSTTVNLTANQTLYAQWTPITYTISYNANGGTGTTASSSHTYGTAKALTTNGFTKFGHTFKGWAKTLERAEAGTVDYNDKASVSNLTTTNGGTVNLYAVWAKYTKVYIYTNKKDGTSKWVSVEKYTYTGG